MEKSDLVVAKMHFFLHLSKSDAPEQFLASGKRPRHSFRSSVVNGLGVATGDPVQLSIRCKSSSFQELPNLLERQ